MSEKVNWDTICRERKAIIALAINNFGDGAHPVASATNLDCFDITYVIQCITSGIYNLREEIKS